MEASISANLVLKRSIAGINKEIRTRENNLGTLKLCITGSKSRWVKPVKNQIVAINKGLRVYWEIKRLRKIKRELQALL
jgi:hypothetical protein